MASYNTNIMYEYHPLSTSRSIRVIELLPSRVAKRILAVNLREVSLDENPDFEALSYAWESQTPDQKIVCNGQELLVTRNCEAVMRRLRLKSKSRLLWIDAICIDQESIEDKNHQVRLMGYIYTAARGVIVWLGERSPFHDLIFNCAIKDCFLKLLGTQFHIGNQDWFEDLRQRRREKVEVVLSSESDLSVPYRPHFPLFILTLVNPALTLTPPRTNIPASPTSY
jgi:hypothetical protein